MANLNAVALVPNLERAEIDTTLPFGSVKAAVNLFGNQISAKKATFSEKRALQDAELLHAQEELVRLKELLETTEREKEEALHELGQAKEALNHLDENAKKMAHSKAAAKEGFASDLHNVQKYGQMYMESKDKYVVWEFTLKCATEKHTAALAEIESAKQQLRDLKQELLASTNEKDNVFKQMENALLAMEGSVKVGECITTELAGVNNWLSILKHASFDVCGKEKGMKGSPNGSQGLNMGQELEYKLLSMMNESIRLREELKCVKDEEEKAISAASNVLVILGAMGVELGKRSQEEEGLNKERSHNRASLLAILEALQMESETLQKEVQTLRGNEAKAKAKLHVLNGELRDVKVTLEATRTEAKETSSRLSLALQKAEAEASEMKTTIKALQEEVSMTRSRAATVEAKAIVSTSQLSQALKQSETDLAEAKKEICTLLEEASKATTEAASMESLSQMSQALKQAEADLVQANNEMKILQDECCKANANNAASMETFVQSYQALKQAEAEVEMMKVDMQALQARLSQAQIDNAAEEAKAKESIAQLSQALKQADAELEVVKADKEALQGELLQAQSQIAVKEAKAQESLAQLSQALEQADTETKLAKAELTALREELLKGRSRNATSSKALQVKAGHVNGGLTMKREHKEAPEDVESIKSALKQALHRAEMAEISKSSAESELRRLREREHERKEKTRAFLTEQNLTKNPFNGSDESSSLPSNPQCQLLGNVLNINISAERTKTFVRIGSRKLRKINTTGSTGIYSSPKRTGKLLKPKSTK